MLEIEERLVAPAALTRVIWAFVAMTLTHRVERCATLGWVVGTLVVWIRFGHPCYIVAQLNGCEAMEWKPPL